MPYTQTTHKKIYTADELEKYPEILELAHEKFFRYGIDYEWYDYIFDDAKSIGAILGIDIDKIYFSGFCSQGDGACFEGSYEYAKGSLKKIKEYAPTDERLHNIAQELQDAQRPFFYGLSATSKHVGHYYHDRSVRIDVEKTDFTESWGGDTWVNVDTEDVIAEILRDFMRWIYQRLESEYDYITSEECFIESAKANEYEFDEYGNLV